MDLRPQILIGVLGTCLIPAAGFGQNTFPSSGNVGIGTTSPNAPLEISSSSAAKILLENPSGGAAALYNDGNLNLNAASGPLWLRGASQILMNPVGGDVGIGTTSPAATLDVGDVTGNGILETALARLGEGAGTGDGTYLGTKAWCTQPTGQCNGQSNVLSFSLEHHFYGQANSSINFYRGGGTTGGFMTFGTGSNNERMRIDGSGNIGIGTTAPGAPLEVNGSMKLTSGSGGSITYPDGTKQTTAWTGVLCGGDYAESMDATGDRTRYTPGDVLVLDADNPGKILKSVESYSSAVAGIYATKPGVVGRRQVGPKNEAEVPMAMIGVVPTKVSAENGSIKVGDLLVSSSIPGFAMKGTDHSRMLGAVIGKAMGSLDSGAGVIEVLVTLQ